MAETVREYELSAERIAELVSQYGVTYIDPAKLKHNPRNPRTHDMPAIRASIKLYGFRGVVVARKEDLMLAAGHGRTKAALELGIKEIPVVLVEGWDDWTLDGFLLADNRTADRGGYKEENLHGMLKEREASGGEEGVESAGYSMPDYHRIKRRVAPEETVQKAKGAREMEAIYKEGIIRQIVLYFDSDGHTAALRRLEPIMDRHKLESNSAAFLFLLGFYEQHADLDEAPEPEAYAPAEESEEVVPEPPPAKPLVHRCINCNKPQTQWESDPIPVSAGDLEGFACSGVCADEWNEKHEAKDE